MKFAKLFEVADTQVLFCIVSDNDQPLMKACTMNGGILITATVTFGVQDNEQAWDAVERVLANLTQDDANNFFTGMLVTTLDVGGSA